MGGGVGGCGGAGGEELEWGINLPVQLRQALIQRFALVGMKETHPAYLIKNVGLICGLRTSIRLDVQMHKMNQSQGVVN